MIDDEDRARLAMIEAKCGHHDDVAWMLELIHHLEEELKAATEKKPPREG